MNIRVIMLCILLKISGISAVSAQNKITTQSLGWLGFFYNAEISKKWNWTIEAQERVFLQPFRQHQLVFRSNIYYRLGANWDAGLSFSAFFQSPNDPYAVSTLIVPELRLHQEFNYRQPIKNFTISHRYMIEERFFHNTSNNTLAAGYYSELRFRYRFGVDFTFFKTKTDTHILKLKVNDEILLHSQKNIFDQHRIYIGINYQPVSSFALEFGYMNWFQQRNMVSEFYNRHILRISVFYKSKAKK